MIGDHVIVREMVKDAIKVIYFLALVTFIPRVCYHVYLITCALQFFITYNLY